MEINIPDELLNKVISEKTGAIIEKKVNAKMVNMDIKQMVREWKSKKVDENCSPKLIDKVARAITTQDFLRGVCSQISNDIANAFADKYGDYN